jgi:hypothetical protein
LAPAPVEVTTDRAAVYPWVLDELLPGRPAGARTVRQQRVAADHGRLKARLRRCADSTECGLLGSSRPVTRSFGTCAAATTTSELTNRPRIRIAFPKSPPASERDSADLTQVKIIPANQRNSPAGNVAAECAAASVQASQVASNARSESPQCSGSSTDATAAQGTRRGRGAEPLGDGVMLIKGMRAYVAAHICCILYLLELDCRIQMRGMGGCGQLLIHDRPDWPGIPGANAQTPGPASGMNPMPDMT